MFPSETTKCLLELYYHAEEHTFTQVHYCTIELYALLNLDLNGLLVLLLCFSHWPPHPSNH